MWFALFLVLLFFPIGSKAQGVSVLFIGDSHSVGMFGQDLHRLLSMNSLIRVHSVASWGTKPNDWLTGSPTLVKYREWRADGARIELGPNTQTPILERLLEELTPDVVIIALGSNFLKASAQYQFNSSVQLASKATHSGARCYWIGPPHIRVAWVNDKQVPVAMDEIAQVYRSLHDVQLATGCTVIDSLKYTEYPEGKGDGLHYDFIEGEGRGLSERWARGVFSELRLRPKSNTNLAGVCGYKSDGILTLGGLNLVNRSVLQSLQK